jgi:heterokaryon incompatibility protein (HET)
VETALLKTCPTRLIDVAGDSLRLVSLPADRKVSYAALSHCWGDSRPIITTKENLQSHLLGISLNAMPKTFQDAIMVTRELGIHYIWIDSLCIIQNDAEDWEREAAMMAAVYENADITIAAAWGADGRTGCFHDHSPTLIIEDNTGKKLYFRPLPDSQRYLGRAHLNTRAWALQENILARRTVIFAEDQWYWICSTFFQSEDQLSFLENIGSGGSLPFPMLGQHCRAAEMPTMELYESWGITTGQYSSRSITYPTDKLAALAGITSMFQRALKDDPYVGLWRKDLPKGLLWQVPIGRHGKLDIEAIQKLNIPSWSWIKIDGTIEPKLEIPSYPYPNLPSFEETGMIGEVHPCLSVNSVDLEWTGLPMTSSIKTALIYIRGRVIQLKTLEKRDEQSECACHIQAAAFDICHNGFDTDALYPTRGYIDECCPSIDFNLLCLPVYFRDTRRRSDSELISLSALILTPIVEVDTSPVTKYRRLGIMDTEEFPRGTFDICEERDLVLA